MERGGGTLSKSIRVRLPLVYRCYGIKLEFVVKINSSLVICEGQFHPFSARRGGTVAGGGSGTEFLLS